MGAHRRRRGASLLLLGLVLVTVVAGCGSGGDDQKVGAGGASGSQDPSAQRVEATTTTDPFADAGRSPIANLTPADLRRVVEADGRTPTRGLAGPVAEPITIDGRTIWRVRIPGHFQPRSARQVILVGGHVIGAAVVTPGLDALVTATTDRSALVDGAEVGYQAEGGEPVDAGRLVVAG